MSFMNQVSIGKVNQLSKQVSDNVASLTSTTQRMQSLFIDVMRDYGASGSTQTTNGSISSGSNILTLSSSIDFVNGQGIALAHAGNACSLTTPTGLTVTPTGAAGSTTYQYQIVAIDTNGGSTSASSLVSTSTGNATLSYTNYNTLTWTAVSNAASYTIYGGASGSMNLLAISSTNSWSDTGRGSITVPWYLPSSPSVSSLAGTLVTTISSGGGTTTLTLANSASSTTTSQKVQHDDTKAIQNALNAAQNGAIYFPNNTYFTSSSLVVPSPIRIDFATHMTTIKFTGTGDAFQIFNQKHVYWNKGTVDVSCADSNAVGIHVGGLWYGTFVSPRVVKAGLNSVGILIDSSKPNGTHWGAYIIRIQDYESIGAGFADIQTRQATGDNVGPITGTITHLTIDGGWTTGGTYGIYLDYSYSTNIRGITCEGGVVNTPNAAGIYVSPNNSNVYITGIGEIDSYSHGITVDGANQVYVMGDNTNGTTHDVNIINGGVCHRTGQNMVRVNGNSNYAVELHSDFNYATSFRINTQGGGANKYDIMKWGENAGVTLWSGTASLPITLDAPVVITAKIAANVPNGSLFLDSADNKLKFKDSSGTINLLY